MEDQPADSGDLTTEPAPARRRHRMPLKRRLTTETSDDGSQTAGEAVSEDAPEPAVEAIEDARAETASAGTESTAPENGRRWGFLRRLSRRRAVSPESNLQDGLHDDSEAQQSTDDAAPTADVTPAPRTPMGKAGRASRSVVPAESVGEVADESLGEVPGEGTAAEDAADESSVVDTGAESDAEPPEPDGDAGETDTSAPQLLPHRPAGTRLQVAVAAAAVLFVAGGAFAGATLQPYLADRAAVDTKVDVARTAAEAITTLWSYTPDDMDTLADRASHFLGGDFATEYRRYIDAIVETNKQAQVTNSTQVLGAAVESLSPAEATAIVYTNSVSTSPVSKNIPSLRYLSYRLTLQREDATWLITRMNAVTQLDLTPQL